MSQPSFFNISISNHDLDGSHDGTLVEGSTLEPLARMSSLRRGVNDQVIEARSKEDLSS